MKNISTYLHELLVYYDCVIVPDFGAFITNTSCSRYDFENGYFIPPEKQISFNKSLKINDGLLANYIATQEKISYQNSINFIKNEVSELISILNNNKRIYFKNIGSIYLDKTGLWIFTAEKSNIVFPQTYGLPTIIVNPTNTKFKDALKELTTVNDSKISLFKAAVLIPAIIALSLLPGKITKQSDILKGLMYETGMQTSYIIKPQLNNTDELSDIIDNLTQRKHALNIKNNTYVKQKELSDDKPTEETNNIETSEVLAEIIHEEKTIEEQISVNEKISKAEINIIEQADNRFHFISGSFIEMWRAEKYMKEIAEKGFKPVLIESGGRLRISISAFKDQATANVELQKFKQKYPDIAVWILKH